jgi:trehalose 6-phosphate phosphatase
MAERMREVVRLLAERYPVCVVSGRDREAVQQLMGIDSLVVAGSHGFDIWSPAGGSIGREKGAAFRDLLDDITKRLHAELDPVSGAVIEPKKASVAVHERLVAEAERPRVKAVVDAILAAHPDDLKITPGKLVYELQPKLDWDKGKAVLYLLDALGLERDDMVPIYLGDDWTDEHAFEALADRGIGIFVGRSDDPEVVGRTTSADFILHGPDEVQQFLLALVHATQAS